MDYHIGWPRPTECYTEWPRPADSYAGWPRHADSYPGWTWPTNSYTEWPSPTDSYTGITWPTDSHTGWPRPANSYTEWPRLVDCYTGWPWPMEYYTEWPRPMDSSSDSLRQSPLSTFWELGHVLMQAGLFCCLSNPPNSDTNLSACMHLVGLSSLIRRAFFFFFFFCCCCWWWLWRCCCCRRCTEFDFREISGRLQSRHNGHPSSMCWRERCAIVVELLAFLGSWRVLSLRAARLWTKESWFRKRDSSDSESVILVIPKAWF